MKNMFRNTFALAILLTAAAASTVYSQEDKGGGRLSGAWDATVTITNCATGAPIRSFNSFATFSQGGTYTGITAGTPPSLRSPELGIWRHVRGNVYMFRFKAYLFDATGMATGYQVVTHQVDLDADNEHYTSAGGNQIFNMAGMQVGTGCSTAVGTRMEL